MSARLETHTADQIWLVSYPVRYFGTRFESRTTLIRLSNGGLFLHSPCAFDADLCAAVGTLGAVSCIVAPGSFHHIHVGSAQAAFPDAATYICPGIERKCPGLHYDEMLGDTPPDVWAGDLDQIVVRGNRWIAEVAFFHRESRTLLLVDSIENFTDVTPNTNWQLRLWFKLVFRMWNEAKPAPEYQLGWWDKRAARDSLKRILAWDFHRVILAHGELIETNARAIVQSAWRTPLSEKS